MKRNMKLILVVGARPNFMKIAPLLAEIRNHNSHNLYGDLYIDHLLVHTGQHYDLRMSDAFFRDLDIPNPDVNLNVGSGSHAVQTAEILIGFEKLCLYHNKVDWIVVVGDVNSTMACTLVASKLAMKVAHIEAGLRSYDRSMPEEINRLVTDALADLLFTPSEDADENLLREGVQEDKIQRVGNIMIDTLSANLEKARCQETHKKYGLDERRYIFVTIHRPANVDNKESLSSIMQKLTELSHRLPVIFPLHPRTEKMLVTHNLMPRVGQCPQLNLCQPLGYLDTIGLVDKARFVLTDSGGLQEETTYLRVPCLTLRPNTERPITIKFGTNRLTSLKHLDDDVNHLLGGHHQTGTIPELWDGHTSRRIIKALIQRTKGDSQEATSYERIAGQPLSSGRLYGA